MFHAGRAFTLALLLLVSGVLLVGLPGCDTPEKALKSTDLEYKKAKAISWYKKKEYYKAIPLLEELIGLMKGRESTEDLYYMYADANYHQGDYLISAYHFKNFYDLYPNSEKAEECLYMYAKSYEMLSPKPDLDQTYTQKAIDAFQLFLNAYPNGSFITQSNEAITNLRKKLERKALNTAELYYRTSNYRAAAVSYANILKDFPDIEQREMVTFMIIKSYFEFADNSIPDKKAERFDETIKSYAEFKDKYPQSKYLPDADKLLAQSHFLAVQSAYEWTEIGPLDQRGTYFNTFLDEVKKHSPLITDKRETNQMTQYVEKGYY
ncbi:MAG TPA: outer membrane protein assembly factor BamD, partial [Chitinophagales bacterium]|nr:outer membrane protein assembly factor BamD [Chitinophagales bacterium]